MGVILLFLWKKKCAMGKNRILKFFKNKNATLELMVWELFSLGGTWRVIEWGRLAFSLLHLPSPGTSPCPGFPQQQHLGTEPKTSTSFSCHSPLGSQGHFTGGRETVPELCGTQLPHLCSFFSKCLSLPPPLLVGVSAAGFTPTLFFILFSLL